MITIGQPSFEDLLAVAKDLRPDDARELSVTRDISQPTRLATDAWRAKHRRMAYLDDQPVFAFGIALFDNAPEQGVVWGFGTADTPRVIRTVTKYLLRTMIPEGIEALQALTHPENALSARWLRHLGFSSLAITVPGLGAGKHDMILWITIASDQRHKHHSLAA